MTATNAVGSATARSAQSGVVVPAPPVNISLPVVSGSAEQGTALSASQGTWTNTPTSYRYQWQQCDTLGSGCTPLSGATATSVVLTAANVNHRIRVSVTAINGGGSTAATSWASETVSPTAASQPPQSPSNISVPTISGTPQQGQTLIASSGSWSEPATYAYRWLRCDREGAA